MPSVDRILTHGSPRREGVVPAPLSAQLPLRLQDNPRARLMSVGKGGDVLVGGSRYGCWYLNHDGWLVSYKILHKGDRQILDFILPGEIFGLQAWAFKSSLYSVAAVTKALITTIPFDVVDDVLNQSPQLSKALLWSAISEAARLAEHVIDAGRRSAYERLSHLFLELFLRSKLAGLAKGMSFNTPLTQELIGDALGLSTIHVNRTLRCLREDKLIGIDGKRVTILDFDALALLCDFENSYLGESARAWNMPQTRP